MNELSDITIRTELRPGDLGQMIHLHGKLYHEEFGHGISFESIVAGGLHDFYQRYDPKRERIWLAEHQGEMVGSLLLQSRDKSAQLRYFLILSQYRGQGLGNLLMKEFIDFMQAYRYRHAYLWTTNELGAAGHLYSKFGFQLSEEKPSTDFGKALIEQRYDLYVEDHEI